MMQHRREDYVYTLLPDGTAKITRFYGEPYALTIPSHLEGHPVTVLGDTAFGIPFEEYHAFEDPVGRLWETVTIEEGITAIENRCFCRSHYMEQIQLPSSLRSIGIGAFLECGLHAIHIPSRVTSIGRAAFSDCRFLQQIWLPDGITRLEDYLFDFCGSLHQIHLPNTLTEIGEGAFRECRSLISLQLPHSLTAIAPYAFHGCTRLQQLRIPERVSFIGEDAFAECEELTLQVQADSYGEQYAKKHHIPYRTEATTHA